MSMPKRWDEVVLWNAIPQTPHVGFSIIEIANKLEIPLGRAYYLACKWADKGIYQWGTFWWRGWKEPGAPFMLDWYQVECRAFTAIRAGFLVSTLQALAEGGSHTPVDGTVLAKEKREQELRRKYHRY